MSYNSNLKTWGATGSEYPDGYAYEGGEQPVDEWDNFLKYNIVEDIKHLIDRTNDDLVELTTYNSHASDNSAHHARYSDSEARTALEGSSPTFDLTSTGTLSGDVVSRSEVIDNLEGNVYLEAEGTDPGTVLENDGDMVFIHE